MDIGDADVVGDLVVSLTGRRFAGVKASIRAKGRRQVLSFSVLQGLVWIDDQVELTVSGVALIISAKVAARITEDGDHGDRFQALIHGERTSADAGQGPGPRP